MAQKKKLHANFNSKVIPYTKINFVLIILVLFCLNSCKKRKIENIIIGEWIEHRYVEHVISDYYFVDKYVMKEDHIFEHYQVSSSDSVTCNYIDTLNFNKEREDLYKIKRYKGSLHLHFRTKSSGYFALSEHSWSRRNIKDVTENEIIFTRSDGSERKWVRYK